MPAFTVAEVIGEPRDWQSKYGPMKSYRVAVKNGSSDEAEVVELSQKPDTAAPTVGQALEGEIVPSQNPQFPPKFKKAQQGGGGFSGGGGMSPEREKRIVRQHSQSMSIETLKLAVDCGINLQVGSVSDVVAKVRQLSDVFDKDAGV